MKQIDILICIVIPALVSPNLMAQDFNAQSNQDLMVQESRDRLRNGGEIPGFYSSPPGVNLLKNAITNPDGSKTIKKGNQTPEANELNRKYCESFGAKDITNDDDITIGSGTLYAGVCLAPIGQHPPATAISVPGLGTGRIFLPIPNVKEEPQPSANFSVRSGSQIVPYATNGSTAYNTIY